MKRGPVWDVRAPPTPTAPGRHRWWHGLSSWTRVSFLGLLGAGLLAVGLGVYIPRKAERHMLLTEVEADRQVLAALVATHTLDLGGANASFAALDDFVHKAILRGHFVRAKLWSPEGRIIYSDEHRLVGRSFPPSRELLDALRGRARTEISGLSEPENELDRGLAHRLLELYLPVEQSGRVVAVWEVYRSLDRFEEQLGLVRRAVWASVGAGLVVLLVFLASSFGSLLAAVQRRRREAEQRSRELATLLDVSRSVSASLDPGRLTRDVVRTIRAAGAFRSVSLVRRGAPEGSAIVAASAGAPCPGDCVLDVLAGVRACPFGCVPFAVDLGGADDDLALVACRSAGRGFGSDERALLEAAGKQARVGLENARLYDSLQAAQREQRELMGLLVSAHEEERKRIVGDIHDGLGQDLHRVLFGLRGCRESPADEVADEVARLEKVVEQSSRRLRRLLQELRPSTLDDVGLAAALRGLADRMRREDGMQVEVRGEDLEEPAVPVRVAIFRIVQEALRNVAKHTGAKRAEVALARDDGAIAVRVCDGGPGIPEDRKEGLGFWLMRERAEALGGSLTVSSSPTGTTVAARIPLEAHHAH